MTEQETKVIYEATPTGHWMELFPKKNMVLGAHNLNDGEELVLIIDHIKSNVEIKTGRKADPIAMINLIYFVGGKPAPMAMNVTNARILESLYGEKHAGWIGKAMQIHKAQVRNPEGKGTVWGLCIRKLIPDMGEDVSEYVDKINNAADLDELRAAWTSAPKHIQPQLIKLTNERKAALS